MLPQPILDELWAIQHRVSDVVTDFIAEELAKVGLLLATTQDLDSTIYLLLKSCNITCELRIDRIQRRFTLVASSASWTWMPVTGDWDDIMSAADSIIGRYKQVVAR